MTQLQQELVVHAESSSGSRIWTCRRSASNQQSRDSSSSERPSESHRCGPKEFSGKEEDFQQWSKKMEAFFAGVIKESEMMLEWPAEQPTEITTTAIDLEFLPTDTNEDRQVQNLDFVLQQMHTAHTALTSYEANDIVANSRKNPLESWRRLQKRYDLTTGGWKRNLLRTIISPGRCSLLELQAGMERWESYVSRYEKKMKDKLGDEIKLAGLESLVPEELEKHLILNSDCLRTFEDARLEVVTHLAKHNCHRVRVMGVLWSVEHIFNETAMNARTQASNRLTKANRASRSKSEGKGKSEENKRKSKGKSKGTNGAKGSHNGKTSKTGLSGLENSKSEASSDTQEYAQTFPTDTSWNDGWNCDEWNKGWSFDEWNDDWSSVGWHEGWEQTYDTSASSFSLGVLGSRCHQSSEAV